VQLLEDLSRPYSGVQTHPLHILYSELYVLELLAECCSTHWTSINSSRNATQDIDVSDSESSESENGSKVTSPTKNGSGSGRTRRASRNKLRARRIPPESLSENLVRRLIDAVKLFLRPFSDTYMLPTSNILDDTFKNDDLGDSSPVLDNTTTANRHLNGSETSNLLLESSEAIEASTRGIVEYLSFSNWSQVLESLKLSLRTAHPTSGAAVQTNILVDDDSALVTLRLISSLWIDGRKLSVVIQELCGSFLHLRKAFQTTVAIVLPLLITRWIERNPEEFISLHNMHKRLDGGADTLFDMANTMYEGGRRKSLFFPFQTSLLFLLPDIFEVASNMRDVKSSSISKKVSFLEMLRKSLRGRNEAAIYCLTTILRAARHFDHDSDAALLSYALDVQEEVREAVFRRYTVGVEPALIDSGLMTAAFVSLAHLSFETAVENLAPFCLAPNAPQDFKIAAISSCSHFAKQSNVEEYYPLFAKVAEFIRLQFKVFHIPLVLGTFPNIG
jgi:neurofibromin 1